MRFKNVVYTHTDTHFEDDYTVKFIADFDIEAIRESGLEVEYDMNLVIEIDVQEGEPRRPFISNLEDNEELDTTDIEAEYILNTFKKEIKNN